MYTTSVSLIDRVKDPGDHQAWSRFVALYTPFLFHCCGRMGLSGSDAADAVQEVFVLLFAKLPAFQYSVDGSFRAWLRTVTMNKCREMARKRHEVPVGGSEPGLSQLADEHVSKEFWDAEYQQMVVAKMLESIQANFETTTWKAFWLTTIEDRPIVEVTAELGITANAVYVARSRVLRSLREQFAGLLDE